MPTPNRRARLLRFKVLMEGFIAELNAIPVYSPLYGFSGWMMSEMNDLADSFGWCPGPDSSAPPGLRVPFWRRGDFGLTIFDASGGSWNGSLVVPEPADEQSRSWGGRREDGQWVYPDDASSEEYFTYLSGMRGLSITAVPMLRSWIVKCDAELVLEESGSRAEPAASPKDAGSAALGLAQFEQPVDDFDQAAALVNRSKRTLERRLVDMPMPAVQGAGGKKSEWVYADLRPWLEQEYGKKLPERPHHVVR